MVKYYSVNGKVVLAKNAKVQINDLGLLRGYGIFDFLKVQNGVPIFIEDHLKRFRRSAKYMGLKIGYKSEELQQMVLELIKKNKFKNGGMKIVLTGGYSENGYLPSVKTNLFILLNTFTPPTNLQYKKGVKLMLHDYVRELPEVKTTNYIVPIRLAKKLKMTKSLDVLYIKDGYVSESSRSNFFIVKKNGTILTPDTGVLKGITRNRVIKIAKKHYKLKEGRITVRDLKQAKEAFLTSTTKGALPVVTIDNITIGNGKTGNVTEHINELLNIENRKYFQYFNKKKAKN